MAQTGPLSTPPPGRFWQCGRCSRFVPIRLDACKCGGTRPAETATPAPVTPGMAATVPATPAAPAPASYIPPAYVTPVAPLPRAVGATLALDDLVYPNERALFLISAILSGAFWLLIVVGTLGVVLVYALLFFLFYLFAQSGLIAYIRGNAVRITPQQFPDLYERLAGCCQRLGMEMPETYLLHADGAFNAFATRFLGRNFLVLYADVVDALEARPGALNFYLGHELGHVHRGHLLWRPLLLPASFLPLVGPGYQRACETTCDNYGAACCDDKEDAIRGLSALGAGGKRWQGLNVPEYLGQARETAGFWMSFHELISDYPWLVKRVARVAAFGEGQPAAVPARNPLAYLFALFVPRTMAGAGAAPVLMMVVVIGIIAAIAIPSLLRARIAANEAATIGDVRTVVSAQSAYASVAGNYGALECLAAPGSRGCVRNYPPDAPRFLSPDLAAVRPKSGYRRLFAAGQRYPTARSPAGFASFCYAAVPATQGQTGVRSYAGDHTGVICMDPGGANLCEGGALQEGCTPIG